MTIFSRTAAAFSRTAATAARHEFGKAALIIAGIYAALVVGAGAVVGAVVLFSDDPGFIGIWLILVTEPTSMLLLWLTDSLHLPGPLALAAFEILCVGAGLLQAWAMWRLFRGRRVGMPAPATASEDVRR